MALGKGNAQRGYDATSVPAGQRGTGYLLAEGGHPVRMRSYVLEDDDITAIVARAESTTHTHPPSASDPVSPGSRARPACGWRAELRRSASPYGGARGFRSRSAHGQPGTAASRAGARREIRSAGGEAVPGRA